MTQKREWSIVFYIDDNGNDPVGDFLDTLDLKTLARIEWAIEQLRIRNVHATEPLVKHLDDKLWELRRDSAGNTYRLLYFFFTGKQIVFVHGFQKKSQKTPRSEIEIAQARIRNFLARDPKE